ncbi:unnamed protein product [Eruca vesicaria subsp. sativa]|uniref:Uncharacterized protein n=1 Tax=Eruca vesicaria subsp. sativa TaxID=29727 RepID=A0ABC8M8E6_ERUVS|nr:unnamed protein product [Eruca vesicaria subsp. sativa]
MDSQAQLQRTHGHHQAEEPIRIHHHPGSNYRTTYRYSLKFKKGLTNLFYAEEEEHHEKGPAKVMKKAKEKVKKALTKHGHGHEQELYGAAPEMVNVNGINNGLLARGRGHHISDTVREEFFPDPMKEDIVPPGTKLFPIVSETTRGVEPVRVSHGREALSRPVRPSGVL